SGLRLPEPRKPPANASGGQAILPVQSAILPVQSAILSFGQAGLPVLHLAGEGVGDGFDELRQLRAHRIEVVRLENEADVRLRQILFELRRVAVAGREEHGEVRPAPLDLEINADTVD